MATPSPGTFTTGPKGELEIEDGSLYPALNRMLLKGWVKAEWGSHGEQPEGSVLPADAAGKNGSRPSRARSTKWYGRFNWSCGHRNHVLAELSTARSRDQEWREEMESHLQMLTDSFLEQGLTPRGGARRRVEASRQSDGATGGDLSHERYPVARFDFRRRTLCAARVA